MELARQVGDFAFAKAQEYVNRALARFIESNSDMVGPFCPHNSATEG
jgi:hypothetical protein